MVLRTPADIAVIGGSAGCGKTWLLEAEAARSTQNPRYGATIFRRTSPQIRSQGGLWDTSKEIYQPLGARPRETSLEWLFPAGSRIAFRHLEHEKNIFDYQGAQIPFIGFDELTHFTAEMFWYMVSRNRSNCGVKPYIRGTCNPDPNSWVAHIIEWWINEEGFPDPAKKGKLRYFTRIGEDMIWGDTKDEVIANAPHLLTDPAVKAGILKVHDLIKSFTFIGGSIYDNPLFIRQDPAYLGNLLSMKTEEKLRLLDGNWKISLDGLMIPEWNMIEQVFSNYPEQSDYATKYITCDAARFGRDFCVIFVWRGWEVIHIVVYKKSDVHDVKNKIEDLRRKFNVLRDNVIVDQDGVGGGTVKLGDYTPFNGGHPALIEMDTRIKEFYFNLKTQCYYRFAERRVNTGQIRFTVTNENCEIYDDSSITPYRTTKIKVGNKIEDIRDLIKQDLRVIRRSDIDTEGKKKMISKDEQKQMLKRSPDFGDTAMMREYAELRPERKSMSRAN
jgi:hypothetical protein